jgi:hypothetical protein
MKVRIKEDIKSYWCNIHAKEGDIFHVERELDGGILLLKNSDNELFAVKHNQVEEFTRIPSAKTLIDVAVSKVKKLIHDSKKNS